MKINYKFPPNVVYYKEIYLFDTPFLKPVNSTSTKKKMGLIFDMASSIQSLKMEDFQRYFKGLDILGNTEMEIPDLLNSREAWDLMRRFYDNNFTDLPFLEFIWSYKAIVVPMINLVLASIPRSKIYYSLLTGYAGLLASIAKIRTGSPFILTEHGIYHRERMMEINEIRLALRGRKNRLHGW